VRAWSALWIPALTCLIFSQQDLRIPSGSARAQVRLSCLCDSRIFYAWRRSALYRDKIIWLICLFLPACHVVTQSCILMLPFLSIYIFHILLNTMSITKKNGTATINYGLELEMGKNWAAYTSDIFHENGFRSFRIFISQIFLSIALSQPFFLFIATFIFSPSVFCVSLPISASVLGQWICLIENKVKWHFDVWHISTFQKWTAWKVTPTGTDELPFLFASWMQNSRFSFFGSVDSLFHGWVFSISKK
jgi:hypothetical protein